MTRPLTAFTLSAALALTSLPATPARALDAETLGQLIFGAAAVAVIAKLVEDDNDDPAPTPAQPQTRITRDGVWHDHGGHGWHWHPEGHGKKTHKAPSPRPPRSEAPSRRVQCMRKLYTEDGWVKFYSQACLARTETDVTLPQSCLRQSWKDGRWVQYFSRSCLRKHGIVDKA